MATITLPPPELRANDDGSQTEVFYRINEAGKKVKVTRRVTSQLQEISTPQQRRSWARYGSATQEKVEIQKCEPVNLRLVPRSSAPTKDEEDSGKKVVRRVACRYCQGDHLSYQCPLKDKIATSDMQGDSEPGRPGLGHGMPPVSGMPPVPGMPPVSGKYVPPSARGAPPLGGIVPGKYVSPGMAARASGALGGPGGPMQRDESATLRITNLPDNVKESDLMQNFGTVGRVTRCNVVKNKMTGLSRGFAFVEFDTPAQAERARQRFDGVAVGSMIMHVDFSEPRPK